MKNEHLKSKVADPADGEKHWIACRGGWRQSRDRVSTDWFSSVIFISDKKNREKGVYLEVRGKLHNQNESTAIDIIIIIFAPFHSAVEGEEPASAGK